MGKRIVLIDSATKELGYQDDDFPGGLMKKSVYDTDENDIVDNSEKLEGSTKAQVQDHTPKAHTHALIDNNYGTSSVSAASGAWTDLLTVQRTTSKALKLLINGGFIFAAGAVNAGNMQIRILINAVHERPTWRALAVAVDKYGFLETHCIFSLAAGSHTIKLQYNCSVAGMTIYDRDLAVLWTE